METKTSENNTCKPSVVHFILSNSYFVFFVLFVVGVMFHIYMPIPLFVKPLPPVLGVMFLFFGSYLILWAQNTSHKTKKQMLEKNVKRDFARGPYKYSRNPTHIGLTVVVLGFALLSNSMLVVVSLFFSSLITKFVFLRKEEKHLEKNYGQDYLDYKNKVRTWL